MSEAGKDRPDPPKVDDLGEDKRGYRETLFFPQNKASPLTIDVLYALSARATEKQGEDRRTTTDELLVDMLVGSALSEEAFPNKFLHNKPKQTDYA